MELDATITKADIIVDRNNYMFNPTTRAGHYPDEGILKIEALVKGDPNILKDIYASHYVPGHKIMPTKLAIDKDLIHIMARLTTAIESYREAALRGVHVPPVVFEPVFIDRENLDGHVKKLLLRVSKTLDDIKELLSNQESK